MVSRTRVGEYQVGVEQRGEQYLPTWGTVFAILPGPALLPSAGRSVLLQISVLPSNHYPPGQFSVYNFAYQFSHLWQYPLTNKHVITVQSCTNMHAIHGPNGLHEKKFFTNDKTTCMQQDHGVTGGIIFTQSCYLVYRTA